MEKKKNRIVVMGGSFNPPTTAHYTLMKKAVDALEANIGFFVPVSDAYLKRKMRHSHPPVVLSPEMRVRMLRSMCSDGNRLQVCEKEIGTIEARTMRETAMRGTVEQWKGENMLGCALMDVRDWLRESQE